MQSDESPIPHGIAVAFQERCWTRMHRYTHATCTLEGMDQPHQADTTTLSSPTPWFLQLAGLAESGASRRVGPGGQEIC